MNMNPVQLAAAADAASEFLKSLASPVRLRILCMLCGREASVGELAETLGVRQSVASQHLALLRKDGMVSTRRDGQTIWYTLADARVVRIMEALQATFCAEPAAPAPGRRSSARADA
jgi:ArsR family transcriptional regulator, virulence genes transcriptional regulator